MPTRSWGDAKVRKQFRGRIGLPQRQQMVRGKPAGFSPVARTALCRAVPEQAQARRMRR
ncbi:hypothetical protein ABZ942_33820 [Nocardia sp. NPDC046473]|uniref:hypothetical protein n=1 Tax=Nocardia sp. NPDC046473 TaxID=3155733 RepID=UPI0033CFA43D